jgi:hypothetical protein
MIGVLVPVIESSATCPKATLIVPASSIRMFPPGQVQESRKSHKMSPSISEQHLGTVSNCELQYINKVYLEFLIGVWAREANALHAQVDRHFVVIDVGKLNEIYENRCKIKYVILYQDEV